MNDINGEHRNRIDVTMGADGNPVCTPDPVKAKGRNALLRFHLNAAGYVFPDQDAIVIEGSRAQFPHPSNTVSPQLATMLDLNTARGTHKYTVTVKEVSSGRLIPLDPSIENGDS